jgi:hypothetical protein
MTINSYDSDARCFTSTDDDETMWDSIRTGTSARVKNSETPLECLFDESPAPPKTRRLSVQEMLGLPWDGQTKIMEEDEGAVTPMRRVQGAVAVSKPKPKPDFAVMAPSSPDIDKDGVRMSLDDDFDDDWAKDDEDSLYSPLSPPSKGNSLNAKAISPNVRLALANISGNGGAHGLANVMGSGPGELAGGALLGDLLSSSQQQYSVHVLQPQRQHLLPPCLPARATRLSSSSLSPSSSPSPSSSTHAFLVSVLILILLRFIFGLSSVSVGLRGVNSIFRTARPSALPPTWPSLSLSAWSLVSSSPWTGLAFFFAGAGVTRKSRPKSQPVSLDQEVPQSRLKVAAATHPVVHCPPSIIHLARSQTHTHPRHFQHNLEWHDSLSRLLDRCCICLGRPLLLIRTPRGNSLLEPALPSLQRQLALCLASRSTPNPR